MTMRVWFARMRDRLQRETLNADMRAELRFHQAMLERDYRAQGMSPVEARRQGSIQLGYHAYMLEETRMTWSLGWFDDAMQDIRYALRGLRHNIGFTTAVILTLALGIGVNTAIFSVVNAVVLRPLPYANPEQLYTLWSVPAGAPLDRNPVTYPALNDLLTQNKVFTAIGGYVFNRFEATVPSNGGASNAEMLRGALGSPTLYEVLDAPTLLGRMPRRDEERADVATISYRVWQSRFGGDPNVVGKTIVLEGTPFTVIGVMPAGFHFPTTDIDLWLTMSNIINRGASSNNPWLTSRTLRAYRLVGRLKAGVMPDAAEREMNALMHRLGEANPTTDAGFDMRIQSLREDTVRDVKRALWLLLGAAGLVLLLACSNVAHLMLARVSTRAREIAIRRALGANRGRVVRQLLTESLLLGALGGAAGIGVAALGVKVLVRLSPGDIPQLENVAIDSTTLIFAVLVAMATGVLFGLAPTIATWRSGVEGAMREQGRGTLGGGARIRSVLTAAEIAFALVLIVGAGLMVRNFASLLTNDIGFRPDKVAVFQVSFPRERYATPQDRYNGMTRVLAALRALPGVTAAGASNSMPPSRMQQGEGFAIEGDPTPEPGKEPTATYIPVTTDFLQQTIGVPLLAGRAFTDADNTADASGATPQVLMISREFARRYFPGRDPLGHRIILSGSNWTIIGVVGDVSYEGIGKPMRPAFYVPWGADPNGAAWVAVKTSGSLQALIGAVRDAVHTVDPLMNAREPRALDDLVSDTMVRPRFQTWLLSTFGGLALVLAAVGIYGVIAYGVAQRTAEIGLRLALGAPPKSVVQLLLRRGMIPVGIGLIVGVAGALALSRLMAGLLIEVSPTDVPTFAAAAILLAVVASVAAYVPTARATRLDPVTALRSE